jgi:hypothetical protein
MKRACLRLLLVLGAWCLAPAGAWAQARPYIGFAYPAGGQQGTTFQVTVGGQALEDLQRVHVTGGGVRARVVDYRRRLSPQDIQLLRDQLSELRKTAPVKGKSSTADEATRELRARIEKRVATYVNRPACASIANVATLEVTISRDAAPGERELRLGTPTGVSKSPARR